MSNPFYRTSKDPVWQLCLFKFKRLENPIFLGEKSKRHIDKVLAQFPARWEELLRFYILRKWHAYNNEYTFNYVGRLKLLIRKLRIKHLVYPAERDYIFRLEEVSFSKIRTMKKLDVPFELNENENCYYIMPGGSCYEKRGLEDVLVDKGNLYVTNRRLVITGRLEVVSINASKCEMKDLGTTLSFIMNDEGLKYYVKCEDMQLLRIAMKRTLGRKN